MAAQGDTSPVLCMHGFIWSRRPAGCGCRASSQHIVLSSTPALSHGNAPCALQLGVWQSPRVVGVVSLLAASPGVALCSLPVDTWTQPSKYMS